MKLIIKKHAVIEIISGLLIFLFVYTASSKFFEFSNFQSVISKSPLIGNFAPIIAWLVPISELLISLLLFIPRMRLAGLYASLIILGVFTTYLGYMVLFRKDLPCSCGGVLKELNWNHHLAFNIGYMGLALTGLMLEIKRRINYFIHTK